MRNPFKHVRIYRSDLAFKTIKNRRPFEIPEPFVARELTGVEFTRSGLIDVIEPDEYVREVQGGIGYTLAVEHAVRVLPASVIKDVVDKRIKFIQENEGREVKGRERSDMIYEVEQELMPKAFIRKSNAFAMIVAGFVFIFTSSLRVEDEIANLLTGIFRHNGVDHMDLTPIGIGRPVRDVFTAILAGTHDSRDFEPTDKAKFENETSDGPIKRVSVTKASLTNGEVGVLLKGGYETTALGLLWSEDDEETLRFGINESLQINGIKFAEPTLNRSIPVEKEDGIGDYDTRAWIIARLLPRMIRDFVEMLVNKDDGDEL